MRRVTRVVAGELGGRRLAVPTKGTRPTSERVREAVFSAIEARVDLDGARVMDCYAGSGALGIEALSRGADHALFVESSRAAAAVLTANLRSLGARGGEVRVAPVETVVAAPCPEPYDVVLADPPYGLGDDAVAAVLAALVANGWVAGGGLLVVERGAREAGDVPWPPGVEPVTTRRYGDTLVCYGRRP